MTSVPVLSTPELIVVSEAAAILERDTRTVHRMVQRGALTAVRKFPGLRGAYLLQRAEVEALARKLVAQRAS